MIGYSSLGETRVFPYTPTALSAFLNSPNYIKPPRETGFIKVIVGDGLVTAEYEEHKRQRRILTPAFAVCQVREITPHFWFKANQLAESWGPLLDNQSDAGIEVSQWMNRVTLDIIGLAGLFVKKELI
jgi:cytochrome P450